MVDKSHKNRLRQNVNLDEKGREGEREGGRERESLLYFKLRYGLALYGKIRWSEDEVRTQEFKDIQKNQNKLLRYLNNTRTSDKISTHSILEKFNLMSVNQLNAQIMKDFSGVFNLLGKF